MSTADGIRLSEETFVKTLFLLVLELCRVPFSSFTCWKTTLSILIPPKFCRTGHISPIFFIPLASSVWLVSPGPGRSWWLCRVLCTGASVCHSAGCSDAGSSSAIPAAWSHSLHSHRTTGLCSCRYKMNRVTGVETELSAPSSSRAQCCANLVLLSMA